MKPSYDRFGGNRIFTAGKTTIALMPESFPQMMMEIREHHPSLWEIVKEKPDVVEILAEVGAYLGLAMDGEYSISKTCEDFYFQLRGKGAMIILPLQAGQLKVQ